MANTPIATQSLASLFHQNGKRLQRQYKNHISDYPAFKEQQKGKDYLLFEENLTEELSIDETALSGGELYTIVTSKGAKGKKGALVAMVKGILADRITAVLQQIPERVRRTVREVSADMAAPLNAVIRRCFPNAHRVVDRFHVQQLAFDAVQEVRIALRWQVLEEENVAFTQAKDEGRSYQPEILSNGDTLKQLLVRSRYLLFKHPRLWNNEQQQRAILLFERYPQLQKAYGLATDLGDIYNKCTCKEQAFKHLALWYNKVEEAAITSFRTVSRSVQHHYIDILNFFTNRTTNAAAESFNAKIKAFRAQFRGVKDRTFFLYRLAKLYA
ncbi:MAG: DDE transposase [Gammaproteobacteria bacterium]|nr:MAG: DDE transposase [Gammaproteobacteria bacterium]